MQVKDKLLEFVERAKERKVNEDRAKEELVSVMNMITEIIPDDVSGYKTDKTFRAVVSWRGEDIDSELFRFCLRKGTIVLCAPYYYEENGLKVYGSKGFDSSCIKDFTYIDFNQLIPAFEEFVDKLSSMSAFKNELKTLTEINNAIKEIINKNKSKE